jgi:hypothetical protein
MMEKMTFPLDKDEEGYPPDDFETLWVEKLGRDKYRIDNIPFYVRNIAPNDIVLGISNDNLLWYKSTISKSNSSVVRIVFYRSGEVEKVLSDLQLMGCKWEGSHLKSLYSIEIPERVDLVEVRRFLIKLSDAEVIDFEEAAIRQIDF